MAVCICLPYVFGFGQWADLGSKDIKFVGIALHVLGKLIHIVFLKLAFGWFDLCKLDIYLRFQAEVS